MQENNDFVIEEINYALFDARNPTLKRVFKGQGREKFFSKLLLSYALSKFGISDKDIQIKTNKFKKPYITNKDIYFNISHSKKNIICALSRFECGIDIEENTERDFAKLGNKLFSKNEQKLFNKLNSENDKMHFFYNSWCAKESFLKCIGVGLCIPLREIEIIDCKVNGNTDIFNIDYSKFIVKNLSHSDKTTIFLTLKKWKFKIIKIDKSFNDKYDKYDKYLYEVHMVNCFLGVLDEKNLFSC